MSPDHITLYQDIAKRLINAQYGTKSKIIDDTCSYLGLTRNALYERLKAVGFDSNRKTRADKGETSIDLDDAKKICFMMDSSKRDNDKRLLSCEEAIDILFANAEIKAQYNASSILRIAKMHGFHPEQLSRPTPHQNLKSLHPNHVWQVDASICILFYLPKGGIKTMDKDEFYKNKPQNLLKVRNELCIRYVITDHYSGTIYVKYYVGSGETQEILFDLLASAMVQKKDHLLHGAPFWLVLDKGAANTAHMVKSWLSKMYINFYAHSTGNSRAKGSVENAQNIVERQFESLTQYKALAIQNVDELNQHAMKWQFYFNAKKKHSRTDAPRFEMWLKITAEQLRLVPSRAVLESLLTTKPQERTVRGDLTISYKFKEYDQTFFYSVKHIETLSVDDRVLVTVNPYRAPNVDVITVDLQGKETYHECTPRKKDEAGFYVDAAIIGEEMKRPPDTLADKMQKESFKAQYPDAENQADAKKLRKNRVAKFGGEIDPFKHHDDAQHVDYIPKKGTELNIEAPTQVFEFITVAEACKRIKPVLGALYTPDTYQYLSKQYPQGVDPLELEKIIADIQYPKPQLKIM